MDICPVVLHINSCRLGHGGKWHGRGRSSASLHLDAEIWQNGAFCLGSAKPDARRSGALLLPFLSSSLDAPRHVCIMVILDEACWTRRWSALVF